MRHRIDAGFSSFPSRFIPIYRLARSGFTVALPGPKTYMCDWGLRTIERLRNRFRQTGTYAVLTSNWEPNGNDDVFNA